MMVSGGKVKQSRFQFKASWVIWEYWAISPFWWAVVIYRIWSRLLLCIPGARFKKRSSSQPNIAFLRHSIIFLCAMSAT